MNKTNLLSRRSFLKKNLELLGGLVLAGLSGAVPRIPTHVPQTPKRIYIAPDDHTDYMWTADERTYKQAFLDMIDYYLDQADATASQPAAYQSRWNCDGSFWLWVYEKTKPAADFQRLMSRVRSGHINVPLNALCSCYGGVPAEAVLRGMYYAGQLERRFDVRFPLAIAVENQTMPYGLGTLWAGAGARYSWKGICGCATQVPDAGDREHDIYWWVGSDGSRLLMKWNSMFNGNQSIGGYAEARDPSGAVDYVSSNTIFGARYPYSIIGVFGKGWDDLETLTGEFVTVAQTKTDSTRQVIVSNQLDFFQDFESAYGSNLPSVSCSFGNEWDLLCASMAEVSARVKRAVEKLRNAEALATLVSLQNPGFMSATSAARDTAHMDLGLYWEHDWSANGPVSQTARRDWQRKIAGEIESYVDTLHASAATALGGMIQKSGDAPRFYAFNALSWSRTDMADLPYDGADVIHVVDLSTGLETPSQIVTVEGQRWLRVMAQNVPATGYKVFEIRTGAGAAWAGAAAVSGNTVENDWYRITLSDRGAITSLIDKTRGMHEFARSVGGRAINDLGAGSGAVEAENSGPVSVTLRATAVGPLSHTTRLTLVRGLPRIDIRNDINQNFGDVQTWSFAFNLGSPDVWHEEVGAVIRARLLAQGGRYSPRNARYDWLTLNHFADMSDGALGVTLSNADCYFMQLGASTPGSLDVSTPQISVLAGGQVDGLSLGIPNQGGDQHFLQRFALQSHGAFDPVAAMRIALEHQNPLVTGVVTGGSAYPEASYSLFNISNPSVLLWALKPAEDGISNGMVVRLWNLSTNLAEFTLAPTTALVRAQQVTHIETPVRDAVVSNGALAASLASTQMGTFLLQPRKPQLMDVYLPLILKQP